MGKGGGGGRVLRVNPYQLTTNRSSEHVAKMLRRKAKREETEGVGAFVDRHGARTRPRQKRRAQVPTESDETGERLESLVFGKQPFQPATAATQSASSEEVGPFENFIVSQTAGWLNRFLYACSE